MKRRYKTGTGQYNYLESVGVLRNGSDAEIALAKKTYWTLYRKNWKKNKRQQSKTYVLLFSFSEQRILNKKASELQISPARFIKQAALENQQVLGPVLAGRIREEVVSFSTLLEEIIEKEPSAEVVNERMVEESLGLERRLLSIINFK